MGADEVEAKVVKEADMLVEVIAWGGGRVCGGGRHGPSSCGLDNGVFGCHKDHIICYYTYKDWSRITPVDKSDIFRLREERKQNIPSTQIQGVSEVGKYGKNDTTPALYHTSVAGGQFYGWHKNPTTRMENTR